jgi:nitrogen PTS system EIIA component
VRRGSAFRKPEPMQLTELLTPNRVGIERQSESGANGFDKSKALSRLATMLATGAPVSSTEVERVLLERESLQSTGIGEGVAIPHGALPQLENQCAALLIVPDGVGFDAIDNTPVTILFAVIGPKRATGEHLKTLARVSRLLRNKAFRDQLVGAPSASVIYDLIASEEAK